ncbi:hypothetical protein [Selenomonas sp. F0473]|uniref:hypothetical protein n=1 Tax=Selenomonas sp. F0473 TaxID=999423 RepID=UPI0025E0E695|nr:hypothetical protein [Selenomonas sp. F0473]
MKIVVTDGYLSMGGKLYGGGEIVTVDDTLAARLIAAGTVTVEGESLAADAVQEDSSTADNDSAEDTTTDDAQADHMTPDEAAEEMTLPEVDPAAAVTSGKRGRGKK